MNERILIVDDEDEVLRICTRALNGAGRGYGVTTAETAAQARACLTEQEFDLLVVDVHLPEEDGISLLYDVQTSHPDLPTMLITGNPAVETMFDALRLNVREYVLKPFTVHRFLEAVASITSPDR